MAKLLEWLVKFTVRAYYKYTKFMTFSFNVDFHTDVHIISQEYHNDYFRYGTKTHYYSEIEED